MTRINLKTGKVIKQEEFKGGNPERQLQGYIEKHLDKFFECVLLKSFFKIPGGEIDTLAITREGNPCIVEYKHKTEDRIINQIVFYYDWLTQKSTKYEYERIVKENKSTENMAVDWSNIRLICVAQEYAEWDKSLIKHLDAQIECYSYAYHEDELDIHLDPIINQFGRQKTSPNKNTNLDLTFEMHRDKADKECKMLLDKVRDQILNLGEDVKEGYAPNYIKYYVNTTFSAIHVRKKWLVVELRVDVDTFKDPKKMAKDITHRNWPTTREIKIDNSSNIDYAMSLIKQAYGDQE